MITVVDVIIVVHISFRDMNFLNYVLQPQVIILSTFNALCESHLNVDCFFSSLLDTHTTFTSFWGGNWHLFQVERKKTQLPFHYKPLSKLQTENFRTVNNKILHRAKTYKNWKFVCWLLYTGQVMWNIRKGELNTVLLFFLQSQLRSNSSFKFHYSFENLQHIKR